MADLTLKHLAAIRSGNYTPQQLADSMESLQRVVNHIAAQGNLTPVGITPPPAPHVGNSVKGGGGILDVSVTPGSGGYRGGENFFDYSSDGWKTTHTMAMGPANNWRGSLGQGMFQVRTYTSHSASAPSEMLYHAPVNTGGDAEPTMQAGQGSGTGTAGYGQVPYTTPQPPKRA